MTLCATGLAAASGYRLLFRDVSFSVPPGEALWVQGGEGAGKSSLLRLLAGMGEPFAGELRWRDRPLWAQREAWQRGILYAGPAQVWDESLSPAESLLHAGRLAGAAVCAEQAMGALRAVGLRSGLLNPVHRLSASQRQQLSLARLFLPVHPQALLLDDPFDTLDAEASERLVRRLEALVQQGAALVCTARKALNLALPRQCHLHLDGERWMPRPPQRYAI